MSQTFSPLGARYATVFTASSLSNLADGILSIGIGLIVITFTISPALVSLATAAFTLPWLLLSAFAGVIIDRSDRRRVMLWATALRAGALAVGAGALWADVLNYTFVLLIVFIFGCAEVFADNAYTVILPALVPASRLAAANSRLLSAQQVTNNFLGAPLAGFLFALGAAWALGVPAALCASAFLVILFGLRGTYRARPAQMPAVRARGAKATRRELKVGLSYLIRHPIFRPLVLASAAQNMIYTGYFAVFILWALGPASRMRLAEEHYGLLFMMLAVGSVGGALIVEKLLSRFHEIHVLGAAWLTAAALLIVPLLVPHVIAVGAMLLVSGLCNTVGNTVSMSLRQRLIPGELLGRVFGASQTINLGLIPVGTITAGLIAQYAGMPAWIIVATACAVAIVIATIRVVPARIIPPAAPDAASPALEADAELADALPTHDSPAAASPANPPSVE